MQFRPIEHEVVDSTSERAFAALAAGTARDGDVHRARAQTAGRGRFGRAWYSAPDEGLYLSVVLLPPPPGLSPAGLTIAAGLAVLDAARALLAEAGQADAAGALRLEWPNDVVDGTGAKLAGVLVETRGLDPARPHYVVGIGLDVAQRSFPPELVRERAVTSLALLGAHASVDASEERVLAALERRLAELAAGARGLCVDFLAATRLADAAVAVTVGAEEIVGDLVGLSIEEGIVLRTPESQEQRIALEHVRAVRAT